MPLFDPKNLINMKVKKMSILALNPHYSFFNFRTRDAIFDPKDGSVQMHLRGKPIQFFAPSDTKVVFSS